MITSLKLSSDRTMAARAPSRATAIPEPRVNPLGVSCQRILPKR
jgi:hypothetical protein